MPDPTSSTTPVPRRPQILKHILEKIGYSDNCPKCVQVRAGDEASSLGHTEACKSRVYRLMAQDPVLKKRLEEADVRTDLHLSRQVEAGDKDGPRRASNTTPAAESAPSASGTRAPPTATTRTSSSSGTPAPSTATAGSSTSTPISSSTFTAGTFGERARHEERKNM